MDVACAAHVRGQLERGPSTSGVTPSRGGASAASEHGVAACHLCGELENETHGLPFTDWLAKMKDIKLSNYFTSKSVGNSSLPLAGTWLSACKEIERGKMAPRLIWTGKYSLALISR